MTPSRRPVRTLYGTGEGTNFTDAAPSNGRNMETTQLLTRLDALADRISALVLERQELRATGAPSEALERNRRELVHAQWELSYALIDRHLPAEAHAA